MGAETRRANAQNQTQIDVNNANIQAQREENQKDRDFQRNQWEREFAAQTEFQRNFWKEQFEAENAYNTPTAQVARLQAAGINPAALVSQISGVSAAAASPSASSPSPSSPSGGHGLSGSIPTAVPISTDAALFSSLAQLNDSLNNAAKVGLQANEQNVMLQRNAANVAADTQVKQENARHMNLQNSILATYGDKQAAENLNKTLNEIEVLKSEGKYKEASAKYNDMMYTIEKQKFGYNEQAFPIMIQNLRQYGETLQAEEEEHSAKAGEASASAKKMASETTYQDYENRIKKIETDIYTGAVKDEEAFDALKTGVIDRIKADAAAAGKDKIVNEIEAFEKSRLDPRNKDGFQNRLNDILNRCRTWLKGIRN